MASSSSYQPVSATDDAPSKDPSFAPPAYGHDEERTVSDPFGEEPSAATPNGSDGRAREVCLVSLIINLVSSLIFIHTPGLTFFVIYSFIAIPALTQIPYILDSYIRVPPGEDHKQRRRSAGQLISNAIVFGELAALGFAIAGAPSYLWPIGGGVWVCLGIAGAIAANVPWCD